MPGVSFVTDYLTRLDRPRPERPGAAELADLHAAHLRRVPFENLSIHLGEPIGLEPDDLEGKILGRHRGGFCYELNGLFARLLGDLGYPVTLLAARVADGGRLGPPLDHLVLEVEAEGSWLVDVGFGDHSVYPLRLQPEVDQDDPGGTFRVELGAGGDLDVFRNGALQCRIERHPRELADFGAMCWYQQTSPQSHFSRSIVCTLQTDDGRVTLSGDRLVRTVGDRKDETVLGDDRAILDAYRTLFGIELDRVPVPRAPGRDGSALAG